MSMTTEELKAEIFENQIDALTRGIVLVGAKKPVTFVDITYALAQAERNAHFVCGFEGIESDIFLKVKLFWHLIDNGFATADAVGHLTLTATGRARSQTKLPPEIEAHL